MTKRDEVERKCRNTFSRSQIYFLLAKALSDSSTVLDGSLFDDLRRIISDSPAFGALENYVERIRDRIDGLAPTPREMNREYTRLFFKGEAPPYECSYVPPTRVNRELSDISGFYRAFGLRPKGERQDNISSELEFMSFLCLKETIALSRGLSEEAEICHDAQIKFLSEHLGRWLGVHHRLVTDKTDLPVYPLLVGLARRAVEFDTSFLNIDIREIEEVPVDESPDLPGCGIGSNPVG